MFKQSRKKIILAIMGSLLLLLAATLTVIMLASYREIRRQNMQMLQRHAERYSLRPGPGEPGEPGEPEGKDGKWDGRQHWDEGQVARNGKEIIHGPRTPYMVPTVAFSDYLTERLGHAAAKRDDAAQIIGSTRHVLCLITCNYYDGYGRTILVCVPKSEAADAR